MLFRSPIAVNYAIDAEMNPDVNNKMTGFISDASTLKVKMDMELPIFGTAKNFVAYDTLDINFAQFVEVGAAEFKLTTVNGLPLDVDLQGYFLSSSGSLIDSLSASAVPILRGAPTSPNGTAIGSTPNYKFVKMDTALFDRIRPARKMIVKYTISTSNNGSLPVRIGAGQRFEMKVGVRAGIKL